MNIPHLEPLHHTANGQPRDFADEPRILDVFAQDLKTLGVAGEERAAKLLYLAFTSRLLDRRAIVKGPSSAGKSFLTLQVMQFFPPPAYRNLSGMSDKALLYSEEPLKHRILVITEATGMSSDFVSYFLRVLVSEGRFSNAASQAARR